ncbi:hypothetical protein O181_065891 [Austropuccinia psidii MF-1]|uniref:Chromo domain-containing protein n=1 Tax=Austropuccinia psidii MF-1 TaxID=1389203 RepID=A0A9Q3EWI1_9BASI|nr:hypothetical protein [Austropuccinia psidii MF-1]
MYVSYHQDYWNTWLPLAEFAYNNSDHSSAKQSPFFTVYGREPHFDSVHITQDTPSGNLSTRIQSVQQDVKREPEVSISSFRRHQESPPPIIIEEEEEREVSQILDPKLKRGRLWYLVEWKGFSQESERSTWEPAENLKNCPELVKDFHSSYPDKPGPNSSTA